MRRLANQSREDLYKSQRDYQTCHTKISQAILISHQISSSGLAILTLVNSSPAIEHSGFVAFGGFLYPSCDCAVTLQIEVGSKEISKDVRLSKAWNRVGLIQDYSLSTPIKVRILLPVNIKISFWGLNTDFIQLPDTIKDNSPVVQDLGKSHLVPETFYLSHETSLGLDIYEEESSPIDLLEGEKILLKKCSYCERLLPLEMERKGALSFHKHNAKPTKHQNECRACKKWRINNNFNPLRTTDQLHESSVITRERKIFLREPEILQKIKERTGAGLKSQVWEQFGRKCFYCQKYLELSEVQLDHTRPLAYLWPIDEHATCLCADHNNQKKEKFPIEFYTETQLRDLSKICGLDYAELSKKELNNFELQRILSDLPKFSREWEPRSFAAISRKILEIRPDIDLFKLLKKKDEALYENLRKSLIERPLSVGLND